MRENRLESYLSADDMTGINAYMTVWRIRMVLPDPDGFAGSGYFLDDDIRIRNSGI